MQQFLIAGSVTTLLAGIFFVTISIIATLRTGKSKAIYAYVFFAISMLILALYLFQWHFAVGRVGPEVAATAATTSQNLSPLWLSGIGTTLLSIMTFAISILIPRWKRPKFEVEFDNAFSREADIPLQSYWLRLKVTNTGKSVARRCIGKIVKFKDNSGERTDLDPVMLHWIGTPWGDGTPWGKPPFFTTIDLNQKEPALLDVFVTKADSPDKAFVFTYGFIEGTPKDILSGTCQIQITIHGDDVEPYTAEYRLTWPTSNYKDVKLEKIKDQRDAKMETSERKSEEVQEAKVGNNIQQQEGCSHEDIYQKLGSIENKIDSSSRTQKFGIIYALGAAFVILGLSYLPVFLEHAGVDTTRFYLVNIPALLGLGTFALIYAMSKPKTLKKPKQQKEKKGKKK